MYIEEIAQLLDDMRFEGEQIEENIQSANQPLDKFDLLRNYKVGVVVSLKRSLKYKFSWDIIRNNVMVGFILVNSWPRGGIIISICSFGNLKQQLFNTTTTPRIRQFVEKSLYDLCLLLDTLKK